MINITWLVLSNLIFELQKWCSGDSLLIVSVRGILLRMYCPFMVECISDTTPFVKGEQYIVSRVGLGSGHDLVYVIQSRACSCRFFKIIGKA